MTERFTVEILTTKSLTAETIQSLIASLRAMGMNDETPVHFANVQGPTPPDRDRYQVGITATWTTA
jgi:hypothetical protein